MQTNEELIEPLEAVLTAAESIADRTDRLRSASNLQLAITSISSVGCVGIATAALAVPISDILSYSLASIAMVLFVAITSASIRLFLSDKMERDHQKAQAARLAFQAEKALRRIEVMSEAEETTVGLMRARLLRFNLRDLLPDRES